MKESREQAGSKIHSKALGFSYLLLGIIGMSFSVYSIFTTIQDNTSVFGTVVSGAFIGAVSILSFIYGFRLIRKHFTPFI